MRIAFLVPTFWPSIGGVQNVFAEIGAYLIQEGHTVAVYTGNVSSPEDISHRNFSVIQRYPEHETYRGMAIHRYPSGGPSAFLAGLAYSAVWHLHRPWAGAFYDRYLDTDGRAAQITRDLQAMKPDAVLGGPYSPYLLRLLKRIHQATGAPIGIQTSLHFESGQPPAAAELASIGICDAVFVNTSYEKERLTAAGVPESRIVIAGVPVPAYSPPAADTPHDPGVQARLEGRPLILFMGRKEEDKGVGTLVEAMTRLHAQFPEARLVLTGNTTPFFNEKIRPWLADKPWIEDLGVVSGQTKHWLLAHARALAMPSRVDSFGIVYLEAWLSGVPVIAADLPAMQCIVDDGVDGCRVAFGDTDALARVISSLLSDAALAKKLGARGFAKAKAWTENQRVERIFSKKLLEISRKN